MEENLEFWEGKKGHKREILLCQSGSTTSHGASRRRLGDYFLSTEAVSFLFHN
jgi:hypothetical protein